MTSDRKSRQSRGLRLPERKAGSGTGSNLVDQGTPRERRERVNGLLGENYFTPKDGVVQPTPSVGETGEGAHHSRIKILLAQSASDLIDF